MAATDKAFYKALGQRVAQRRKAMDLTQVELAKALGIAQQTMAHYEGGSLRIPVAQLPTLAQTAAVLMDDQTFRCDLAACQDLGEQVPGQTGILLLRDHPADHIRAAKEEGQGRQCPAVSRAVLIA
ncbi:MAG: helix-turn-helix domain-containing protein [Xanthomonadaceae bacterium]|nr:helix-turn-helix domain-containing protein [Xanthomonadaceae bacterium]